jgi:hypothetical protein
MKGGTDIMTAGKLNVIGLNLYTLGVLLLFRYGMPYRVPTGGEQHLILVTLDEAEIRLEKRCKILGFRGLGFVLVGTGFHIVASLS